MAFFPFSRKKRKLSVRYLYLSCRFFKEFGEIWRIYTLEMKEGKVIIMPISFTDHFEIDKKDFEDTEAFDVILDMDSRFFIDPVLLDLCSVSEFNNARAKAEKFFSGIIILIDSSKKKGDRFWKRADKLLTFKEISGTCFGYSKNGTSGNAIGPVYRNMILDSLHELIEAGEKDPVIFELIGVFEEGIGCDRISDLLTYILFPEILSFSQKVLTQFEIDNTSIVINGITYKTRINEFNNKPIILIPMSILTPLPIANDFDDIDRICMENERVRQQINAYFDLGRRKRITKREIYELMKISPSFREALISAYKSYQFKTYDYKKDPVGEYIWYDAAKRYVSENPLEISFTEPETLSDVFDVVKTICKQFKHLIEDNGLWELLYDEQKEPKRERAAQQLFFGIADAYCKANNIDLSREVNSGRGPIDFKLSRGAIDKVAVEVKLTSNKQLYHGIETQLPIYMKQESTVKALYLILDNGHEQAVKDFREFHSEIKCNIPYYIIDATPKESASKA